MPIKSNDPSIELEIRIPTIGINRHIGRSDQYVVVVHVLCIHGNPPEIRQNTGSKLWYRKEKGLSQITQLWGIKRTMRKSRISQTKQDRLIEHFIAGSTARTAASLLGVHRNSAALYFRRLRQIIAYELEVESDAMFGNEIEVPFSADFFQKSLVGQWMKAISTAGARANADGVPPGKPLYSACLQYFQFTLRHHISSMS